MLFGATPFATTTFAGVGTQNILVLPNGNGFTLSIGNSTTGFGVSVTGIQLNLATNPVSVISWNPIPPGVNQVWVPIATNPAISWNPSPPGVNQVWVPIDPNNP